MVSPPVVGDTTVNIGDAVKYRPASAIGYGWYKITGIILRKAPMGKLLVGYQGHDKYTPAVEVLWSNNERDLLCETEVMVISEAR
jgi:hypothetical protein